MKEMKDIQDRLDASDPFMLEYFAEQDDEAILARKKNLLKERNIYVSIGKDTFVLDRSIQLCDDIIAMRFYSKSLKMIDDDEKNNIQGISLV